MQIVYYAQYKSTIFIQCVYQSIKKTGVCLIDTYVLVE
nr:MAG TPA: hypothetical protein [Caudoviricetes sp.]